jgi:hypothetical protein
MFDRRGITRLQMAQLAICGLETRGNEWVEDNVDRYRSRVVVACNGRVIMDVDRETLFYIRRFHSLGDACVC